MPCSITPSSRSRWHAHGRAGAFRIHGLLMKAVIWRRKVGTQPLRKKGRSHLLACDATSVWRMQNMT